MGLGVFVVSTLPLLYVVFVLNSLVTPHSSYLIKFINSSSFPYPNLDFYASWIITDFSGAFFSLRRISNLSSLS